MKNLIQTIKRNRKGLVRVSFVFVKESLRIRVHYVYIGCDMISITDDRYTGGKIC